MTRFGDTDRGSCFTSSTISSGLPRFLGRESILRLSLEDPSRACSETAAGETWCVQAPPRGQSFSVEDELKQFITSAPDEQLITMLDELMPIVAAKLSGQGIHRGDPLGLATKIEDFLAEIGIDMRFSRGRLEASNHGSTRPR